jgi:hypothetical protein
MHKRKHNENVGFADAIFPFRLFFWVTIGIIYALARVHII